MNSISNLGTARDASRAKFTATAVLRKISDSMLRATFLEFYVPLRCALGIGILLFTFFAFPAYAQGSPVTDDQVNAVAKRLNCPVCENIPLDVCDTQACVQWRDLIRQKLASGETPEQIIVYFHETYGDRVLQEPPRRGFTGILWVLPLVGIAAAAALFWVALRSMAPKQLPEPPVKAEEQDEYRRRLEHDLEKIR
jgi:cytochrome c-type biogenesis protein CcmH